ncbi:hypothetical protein NDU88_004018 [Pleurodeles waltl]|uniref:Uncharacterized protein n=1 Tax=Pleurodeles waltl TaxID=8319 RepID=A0AAV7V443_PLEWA|nr:hypothetical protein NDU88_004018 [Pleurodeles waltl]
MPCADSQNGVSLLVALAWALAAYHPWVRVLTACLVQPHCRARTGQLWDEIAETPEHGNEALDYSVANREKPYFILGRYA